MAYIPSSVQAAQEAAKRQQELWEKEQQKEAAEKAAEIANKPKPPTSTAAQQAAEAAKRQQELMNQSGQAPSTPQVTSQPAASVGTGVKPKAEKEITSNDYSESTGSNLPRDDDSPISVDTGPSEAEIMRQMIEDAKKARIASMLASLDKMYDAQLEAIAEEEAGVRPRYYDERNRVQGQSDIATGTFCLARPPLGLPLGRFVWLVQS